MLGDIYLTHTHCVLIIGQIQLYRSNTIWVLKCKTLQTNDITKSMSLEILLPPISCTSCHFCLWKMCPPCGLYVTSAQQEVIGCWHCMIWHIFIHRIYFNQILIHFSIPCYSYYSYPLCKTGLLIWSNKKTTYILFPNIKNLTFEVDDL